MLDYSIVQWYVFQQILMYFFIMLAVRLHQSSRSNVIKNPYVVGHRSWVFMCTFIHAWYTLFLFTTDYSTYEGRWLTNDNLIAYSHFNFAFTVVDTTLLLIAEHSKNFKLSMCLHHAAVLYASYWHATGNPPDFNNNKKKSN